MHPDDTAPNPVPFATARGWELPARHTPSTSAEHARAHATARRWQIALLVNMVVLAIAGAALLTLTILKGAI